MGKERCDYMRIAFFDIVDTVTYETEYLIKHAPRFLKKYGFCSENLNPFAYSMREKYGLEQQMLQQGVLPETLKEEAIRFEQQFWIRSFVRYNFTKARFGVKTLIQDLRKNIFQIFFLSVRGSGVYEGKHNAIKIVVKFITVVNFLIHGIKYDNIIFVNNLEEKAEYIKFLNPELIFEDQISLLEKVQQENDGIKGFLINNPHNERKKLPENTIRIYEFQEALKSIYEGAPSKKISKKRGDYGKELFQNFMKFVAYDLWKKEMSEIG